MHGAGVAAAMQRAGGSAQATLRVALRSATPQDRAFLEEVYAASRADELAVVPWSEAQKRAFLHMQFEAQDIDYRRNYAGADFLVITVDERPAGRLYVQRTADEIRIIDIALVAEQRNRGIGTALLTDLLDEARRGGRAVTLHVEPWSPAARLYQRLGFRAVEERGVHLLMEWTPSDGIVHHSGAPEGRA